MIKSKPKKEKPKLHDYDSDEEWYFSWYLDELKVFGIADWSYKPKTFDLVNGSYYTTEVVRPRSVKTEHHTLAQPHTYTPDFLIRWSVEYNGYTKLTKLLSSTTDVYFATIKPERSNFFYCQSFPYIYSSYIDIKPSFSKRDSDVALFSLKRALMLEKHKTHVQAVVVENLFEKTFTPERYLRCDITPRNRKINWKVRSIVEFLNGEYK